MTINMSARMTVIGPAVMGESRLEDTGADDHLALDILGNRGHAGLHIGDNAHFSGGKGAQRAALGVGQLVHRVPASRRAEIAS